MSGNVFVDNIIVTTDLWDGDLWEDGRYVSAEAAPGNGWRYACFVNAIPGDVEGGGCETHMLVSVVSPVNVCRIMRMDGYLAESYVVEHFLKGEYGSIHARPLTTLLRYALGRTGKTALETTP